MVARERSRLSPDRGEFTSLRQREDALRCHAETFGGFGDGHETSSHMPMRPAVRLTGVGSAGITGQRHKARYRHSGDIRDSCAGVVAEERDWLLLESLGGDVVDVGSRTHRDDPEP